MPYMLLEGRSYWLGCTPHSRLCLPMLLQAALRVTLDVIGLAGFGHDYGSVALDSVPSDHLLRVLPRWGCCLAQGLVQACVQVVTDA